MDEILCTCKHVGCNVIESHDEGPDKKMGADATRDDVDVTPSMKLFGMLTLFYLDVTYYASVDSPPEQWGLLHIK